MVSAAFALLTYASSRSYLTDQRVTAARDRAYLDARIVRDILGAPAADPGEAIGELSPEEGVTALLHVDGAWYSSSVAIESDDIPRDVLRTAGDGVAAWRLYALRGVPHLAVAIPIPSASAVYAEVVPLRQLDDTLGTLSRSLVLAALVTTTAGGVIGLLAAGRIVRPLRKLTARAEAIASGDVDERDLTADDRELQPLVQSLNRLLESRAAQDSRFVSDVSHEIRAPLAALSAAIEVMQRRRAQLPERSAQALDLLGEQIDGFQQLVLDLLEISRIDAGRAELRREPSDCGRLVRQAAASVGMSDVDVEVGADVPSLVLLDRRRMGQVLVNLLENARRYAGGATSVSVRREHDVLEIAVCDAGPGVPPDERQRIFGRFERGERGTNGPRGSGLGLALVAEHVALHGGRVVVEDAAGGGARFVVEVPLCEPE